MLKKDSTDQELKGTSLAQYVIPYNLKGNDSWLEHNSWLTEHSMWAGTAAKQSVLHVLTHLSFHSGLLKQLLLSLSSSPFYRGETEAQRA